jgi:DNA mismatch repair ATPase MutL
MSFEKQLQQWVTIDNQLKILNDKVKELRDAKNTLTQHMTKHIEQNKLVQTTFSNSDGNVRYVTTKLPQPLTFAYLEKCLREIIKNEVQVNQIMNYVKQKREIKIVPELKRVYTK